MSDEPGDLWSGLLLHLRDHHRIVSLSITHPARCARSGAAVWQAVPEEYCEAGIIVWDTRCADTISTGLHQLEPTGGNVAVGLLSPADRRERERSCGRIADDRATVGTAAQEQRCE